MSNFPVSPIPLQSSTANIRMSITVQTPHATGKLRMGQGGAK